MMRTYNTTPMLCWQVIIPCFPSPHALLACPVLHLLSFLFLDKPGGVSSRSAASDAGWWEVKCCLLTTLPPSWT